MLMRHWQARELVPAAMARAAAVPESNAHEVLRDLLTMARKYGWTDLLELAGVDPSEPTPSQRFAASRR